MKKILPRAIILLLALLGATKLVERVLPTDVVHVAASYGDHVFSRALVVSQAIGILVLVLWCVLTLGMAIANTNWRPLTIGDPQWVGNRYYRLEVRNPGKIKQAVWMELEEIQFEDGRTVTEIDLPCKLERDQGQSYSAVLSKEHRLLVGREIVAFLEVRIAGIYYPAGQPSSVGPRECERLPQYINLPTGHPDYTFSSPFMTKRNG